MSQQQNSPLSSNSQNTYEVTELMVPVVEADAPAIAYIHVNIDNFDLTTTFNNEGSNSQKVSIMIDKSISYLRGKHQIDEIECNAVDIYPYLADLIHQTEKVGLSEKNETQYNFIKSFQHTFNVIGAKQPVLVRIFSSEPSVDELCAFTCEHNDYLKAVSLFNPELIAP